MKDLGSAKVKLGHSVVARKVVRRPSPQDFTASAFFSFAIGFLNTILPSNASITCFAPVSTFPAMIGGLHAVEVSQSNNRCLLHSFLPTHQP